MSVTKHAQKRVRQRVGVPAKAAERDAERALARGITAVQTPALLRGYMERLYTRYDGKADNIRVYNGFVYIFISTTLITVLILPSQYRKIAVQVQKREMSKDGERKTGKTEE